MNVKLNEDISRKVVLILVVVAVIISMLSTTLVLNTIYNYVPQPIAQESSPIFVEPSAKVTLTIPSEPVQANGKVVLEVINTKEQVKK